MVDARAEGNRAGSGLEFLQVLDLLLEKLDLLRFPTTFDRWCCAGECAKFPDSAT